MASRARYPQRCNSGAYILAVTNSCLAGYQVSSTGGRSCLGWKPSNHSWPEVSRISENPLLPLFQLSTIPNCILDTYTTAQCGSRPSTHQSSFLLKQMETTVETYNWSNAENNWWVPELNGSIHDTTPAVRCECFITVG